MDVVAPGANLRLGDKCRIWVRQLVGLKAYRILIIWQLESWWDEAKALRVDIHAEFHGFAKDILVCEQSEGKTIIAFLPLTALTPGRRVLAWSTKAIADSTKSIYTTGRVYALGQQLLFLLPKVVSFLGS